MITEDKEIHCPNCHRYVRRVSHNILNGEVTVCGNCGTRFKINNISPWETPNCNKVGMAYNVSISAKVDINTISAYTKNKDIK